MPKTTTTFGHYLAELTDREQPLSIANLYRLSDIGREDLAALREAWPAIEPSRRLQVMSLFNEISEGSFEVDFQAIAQSLGLSDRDPRVRRAAVEALWEAEDVALLDHFTRLLREDDDPDVCAAAANALARFVLLGELEELPAGTSGRAEAALLAVIESDDEPPDVQRRALESLGFSSHPRVPALIEAAYAAPDKLTQASAVFAMGRSADERWVKKVLAELRSDSPVLRYEAARAAGELQGPPGRAGLIALSRDEDSEVQDAAIWALGEIGGDAARRRLEELAEDDEERVAEAADEALEALLLGSVGEDLLLLDLDEDDFDEDDLLIGLNGNGPEIGTEGILDDESDESDESDFERDDETADPFDDEGDDEGDDGSDAAGLER